MMPLRFSAGQIYFHLTNNQHNIAQKDKEWIWQQLDTIGDMTQKPPYKAQIEGLHGRVRIDFAPHKMNNAQDTERIGSHVAWIAAVNENGEIQEHPPEVQVVRRLHWSFLRHFNVLESLDSFLTRVLSTARVMSRAVSTAPKPERGIE